MADFNIKSFIENDKSKYHQKAITVSSLKHPDKYVGNSDKIVIRSSWEQVMVKFLDNTERILEWCNEEIVIPYISPVDNRKHNYYPDFYAKVLNKNDKIREWLIEVKPFRETIKPVLTDKQRKTTKMESIKRFVVNQAKWASAREWCKTRGMVFRIITEHDLRV